jgi:hypothetical protein
VPLYKKIGSIPDDLTYLIGIPTVERKQDIYIFTTLESIFKDFDRTVENGHVIRAGVLVFIGGAGLNYYEILKQQFEKRFSERNGNI